MGNKVIHAILRKHNGSDCLVFALDSKQITVQLNSDDQAQLQVLFYEVIQASFDYDIQIVLTIEEGYDVAIFSEIAKEYIEALNIEIKSVKQKLPPM